jgi:hypothetical protein
MIEAADEMTFPRGTAGLVTEPRLPVRAGLRVGGALADGLLGLLVAYLRQDYERQLIRRGLARLEPQIRAAVLDALPAGLELQRRLRRKAWANIVVELVYQATPDEDDPAGPPREAFVRVQSPEVSFSTQRLEGPQRRTRFERMYLTTMWYEEFAYSLALDDLLGSLGGVAAARRRRGWSAPIRSRSERATLPQAVTTPALCGDLLEAELLPRG